MKKYPLSWVEAEKLSELLAQKIKDSDHKFDHLLLPTRGGLVPGYFIARELGIRKIKTICIESYRETKQDELQYHAVDGFPEAIKEPEKWLIVDDIADTGKTLDFLTKKFPGVQTACLLQKKSSIDCDFFGAMVDDDTWVDFPWEKD